MHAVRIAYVGRCRTGNTSPGDAGEASVPGGRGGPLILHRAKRDLVLLINLDRALSRLHLIKKKPRAMTSPHAMVLYLRSRLTGATVKEVAVVNSDRVVEILLSCRGVEFRLMVELTGSAAIWS